ncbi:MAG: hypothetical protein NTV93_03255 [Verrucomicrobia bacterium]|nr:hypothetical protein [Verrucomicrobiota bacterium]
MRTQTILAIIVAGLILEFVFSSNLTSDAKRKAALDRIAGSALRFL